MPCYDPRNDMYNAVIRRFACEALTKLTEEGLPIPEYIQGWWEDHQKWDSEHGRPHKIGYHKDRAKKI